MKSLCKTALIGLCVLLPAVAAQAADPETIEKPVLKPGISWRTAVTDGMTRAVISDNTYTIASVSDTEVVIKNTAGEEVLVLDAAHYAIKRTAASSYDPPLQRLRFPITLGAKWESSYRYNNPQCGPTESTLSFKVARWDDVTTPAGKFRAMRIESDGRWRNGCGAGQMSNKHWVAPDLPVPLKQESIVNVSGRIHSYEVHELQSLPQP